jgi:KDO2-lipid IV(A) lauroyltransferase
MTKLVYYLLYAVSTLPFRVLYALSDMLMPLLYYIIRYRRGVVRHNLTSAFPEKSPEEIKTIEKKFYHWFCDYFLEAIKLLSISDEELNRRFHVKNPEVHEAWFLKGTKHGRFPRTLLQLGVALSRVGKDMNPERRMLSHL